MYHLYFLYSYWPSQYLRHVWRKRLCNLYCTFGSHIYSLVAIFMPMTPEIFVIQISNLTHKCIYVLYIWIWIILAMSQVFLIWQTYLFYLCYICANNSRNVCNTNFTFYAHVNLNTVHISMWIIWAISQIFLIWQTYLFYCWYICANNSRNVRDTNFTFYTRVSLNTVHMYVNNFGNISSIPSLEAFCFPFATFMPIAPEIFAIETFNFLYIIFTYSFTEVVGDLDLRAFMLMMINYCLHYASFIKVHLWSDRCYKVTGQTSGCMSIRWFPSIPYLLLFTQNHIWLNVLWWLWDHLGQLVYPSDILIDTYFL